MKNKHEGCFRGYSRTGKAWYAKSILTGDVIDIITIGFYSPEGGTTGEFGYEWAPLGGKITIRLKAYDDSWDALYEFRDLLKSLAEFDDDSISPDDFESILKMLGIKDTTRRTNE